MKMKTQLYKSISCSKSNFKRNVYSCVAYLQKQEKYQINNSNLHLKETEKEEQIKPKVTRRKEKIKIREEINEIENRITIKKINKTKTWFCEMINKIYKSLAKLIKETKREDK